MKECSINNSRNIIKQFLNKFQKITFLYSKTKFSCFYDTNNSTDKMLFGQILSTVKSYQIYELFGQILPNFYQKFYQKKFDRNF